MKPSEETLTAWIDDALPAEARAQFEADLPADAHEARRHAHELGHLLRAHLAAPPLRNADFFNQSILSQIAPPAPAAAPAASTSPSSPSWSSYLRLLWASTACALVCMVFYTALSASATPAYYAVFKNPTAGEPGISVSTFHDSAAEITVLWLEGLDYLPESQKVVAGGSLR